MKKTSATFLLLLLFLSPQLGTASHHTTPPTEAIEVIGQAVFVNIVRDLELLNGWLMDKAYPQQTLDALRHQNYQEILALHQVEEKWFEESLKYYLKSSVKRVINVYTEIYTALEVLLPPV